MSLLQVTKGPYHPQQYLIVNMVSTYGLSNYVPELFMQICHPITADLNIRNNWEQTYIFRVSYQCCNPCLYGRIPWLKHTFVLSSPSDIVETPLESLVGILSSSIIPVACSMQLLDLQLSDRDFRSWIKALSGLFASCCSAESVRERA
uniref:Signal recognition particle 68 kDa protein, putative n=1 Tax=Arundo donax TaxID=35708 RepID=A0A0A9DA34_ARUDO